MTRVLGLWATLPVLALTGLALEPAAARAQAMEEEQSAPGAAPRPSPAPAAVAPRIPGMEAEQSAASAAPAASLSNFQTPWPAEAPQTERGAVMAQAVEQLRARFADPAWAPQKTMAHGAVVTLPPKVAKACGALHDFRMTTSGRPHHIKEYRGAAKWCGFHPHNAPAKVAGLILYANGSYWLGEVSGTSTSPAMPMPSGAGEAGYWSGMRILGVASPNIGSDKGRGVETFGFSTTERAIFANGAMRAVSLDASGSGKGEMRWPDGRVFRGDFKNKKPASGALMFASGAGVYGKFSSPTEAEAPTFSEGVSLMLAKAEGAFPPGTYRAYAPRAVSDYRSLLNVNAHPERETLSRAPPRSLECPAPSLVPEGWVVWSGGCRGGDKPRIRVYAPDARSLIEEQPGAEWPLTLASLRDGAVTRVVKAKALTADARPAPVGEAELVGERGRLIYRGGFLGQVPDGPGLCGTPAAEGGGEEPCFYAQGARTDEIHLARREAAEAERQLRLAEAAARQQANARAEAQRRAQQAQAEANRRAYEAQQAERRRMAQMEEEEEDDSSSGVNPIYQAMQELQGKYAAAAVDMQNQRAQTDAMQRNIEAQYRARQAEQARQQAQRNADVARQNAALNQQNADAARRAEIARQEAARVAQVRADSLTAARERQRAAMAQAQLQQRQAASAIGGGSASSALSGSSSAGAAARPGAAPSILTFTNNYGWKVGDVSSTQNAQGVSISFTVASSTQAGKHYFRARICNTGSTPWSGGVRLTDSYPDRAHVTAQAQPGGCYALSEQFMASSKTIYVWVKNHGG